MQMIDEIDKASNIITNTQMPITQRMRALFYLKNIRTNNSATILSQLFKDKSVLLKHEAAYVLGQMKLDHSKFILISILRDENQDEIVRHEAGEALGNYLGDDDVFKVLKRYLNDKNDSVRETCYLAVNKHEENKMRKMGDASYKDILSPFDSFDPAFPLENVEFEVAKDIYLNNNECLYRRYKAMFYLRNLMSREAVDVLGRGFSDASALFKHEIAFVFGQMRMAESVKYMETVLANENEHGMVRHECAEALGAVGTDESFEILKKYLDCKVDVVRESVEVALDIHNYESGNEAEYAVV